MTLCEIATQKLPRDLWNDSKTRSWFYTERPSHKDTVSNGRCVATVTCCANVIGDVLSYTNECQAR